MGNINLDDSYILKIALCEDEPADAALLESYIEKSGVPANCRSFENGEAFLASFRAGLYDLIFLDIYMGGMQGVEVAEEIRKKDGGAMIAFTTTSTEYTLESYRLDALKYIEKPVKAKAVKETMELALTKRTSRPTITLTAAGGKQEDIPLDIIKYFEHQGHVVAVHTSGGVITTSQSVRLDDIEQRLPSPQFLRCHRSFIVNFEYVEKADRDLNAFIIKGGGRADIRRGKAARYELAHKKWLLYAAGRDGE